MLVFKISQDKKIKFDLKGFQKEYNNKLVFGGNKVDFLKLYFLIVTAGIWFADTPQPLSLLIDFA